MKRVLDHIIQDLQVSLINQVRGSLEVEKNETTEYQPDQDILAWNKKLDALINVTIDGIPQDLVDTKSEAETAAWHMNSQFELAMMHLKKYLLA